MSSREYWLDRGKEYFKTFHHNEAYKTQETMLLNHLRSIQFSSVLEVGCGFGRITRLLIEQFPNINHYKATDLSPDQIAKAKEYVQNRKIEFEAIDIQSLPTNVKYDLVLACEVLMHIPPDIVTNFIAKMVSLLKSHIINLDWDQDNPPKLSHNYVHQYSALYSTLLSVKTVKKISIGSGIKQAIFDAAVQ